MHHIHCICYLVLSRLVFRLDMSLPQLVWTFEQDRPVPFFLLNKHSRHVRNNTDQDVQDQDSASKAHSRLLELSFIDEHNLSFQACKHKANLECKYSDVLLDDGKGTYLFNGIVFQRECGILDRYHNETPAGGQMEL